MTTLVGSAKGTNTATIPGHQAGDLIIVCATRNASVALPTMPVASGYSQVGNITGTTNCMIVGYLVARSSSEVVGTWTNATELVVQVYRPGAGNYLSIGASAGATGTSSTISYTGITLLGGTSWLTAFGQVKGSTTTNLSTPPTGFTLRQDEIGTGELCGFDTNGGVTSFSTQSVLLTGGTVTTTKTFVVEIMELSANNLAMVQHGTASQSTNSASISITLTNPIGAGNCIVGILDIELSGVTLTSLTDDKGNTYTIYDHISDATNGQQFYSFACGNITNGAKTITASFPALSANNVMQIEEWSGIAPLADPNDGHTARVVTATTAKDNDSASSGTGVTTTVAGDLIYAATINHTIAATPPAFSGTGYVTRDQAAGVSGTLSSFAVEDRVQQAAGAINGTFTVGAADTYGTAMVALKAAPVSSFVPYNPWPQAGPILAQ